MGSWLVVPAQLAKVAGAIAVGLGFVVLVGWVTGIDGLKSVVPDTITMKANTAIVFVMLGGSLIILSREGNTRRWDLTGYGLAAAGMLLAALVGSQYLLGRDLGIDQLLFVDPPGSVGTVHPGRLSPQAALSFVMLGMAILLARRPWPGWIVNTLTSAPMVLGALNVIEAIYRGGSPAFLAQFTQMAIPTSIALIALGVGVTALRPGGGWLGVFLGRRTSSRLARRLLLAAVVIPVSMGWLRLEGERLGLYGGAYGVGLMALGCVIVFLMVIRQTAAAQAQADARRAVAELEMAQAREQAERANHAKSEFLSRMSHELRTPLNSILGFGQLLQLEDLPAEQRESANYIVKGGRHLLGLIDDVLDIARVDTGRLSISSEAVALGEVVDEAVAFVAAAVAATDVQVWVDPTLDRQTHVSADRQRLRQVLVNLLSNAIKYNRAGGSVRVTYDRPASGRLRVLVSDEGSGIRPESRDRLFQPFERLEAESSSVEGTGIGLALSKALTHAMGGTIGVESEVGKGSTFWIDLALAESPIERFERLREPAGQPLEDAARPMRTVVYIEDNASNVKLLERVFELRPMIELQTAMTGKAGLDLVRRQQPALVLLDVDLPDIDGETVLRSLRADPATAEIPVVVVSADATPESVRRLLGHGARTYVTKPLDVEKLLKTVDEALAPAEAAA